ncbi:CorA metal ion transporter [Coemansia sp. RSA 2611]|nr:CorA metal ion transporter [Coemansia sp. RSA 2611]
MSRNHPQPGRRRAGYVGTTMDAHQTAMPPLEQGLAGFNGVVFGSGGGDIGIHESPGIHARTQAADPQVAALQREVAQLRRANQALAAANDARYHTAVRLLGSMADGPAPDDPDRRRQLMRLLLAMLDPAAIDDGESSQDAEPDDARPPREQRRRSPSAAPSPPALHPASTNRSNRTRYPGVDNPPSRPVSRDGARPGPAPDWDAGALREMASQGHVERDAAGTDRYAAESRKALGSHSLLSFGGRQNSLSGRPPRPPSTSSHIERSQSSPFPEQPPQQPVSPARVDADKPCVEEPEKLGALAASLLDPDESRFVQDPNARFVLYSPTAGTFQAPTLDALRSGNMTLADIVEAATRLLTLDQLQHERIAEHERLAEHDQSLYGDSDGENALHIAPHQPRASKPVATASPPAYSPGGCFWLDITDPTPDEMASLARVFGIHPLTVEDIMSDDEGRDKFETFAGYNFIVYRTIDFGEDAQSNYEFNRGTEGIATANFAIVLKPSCVLTFHRARELGHAASVVARLRDLAPVDSAHAVVTPAYIAYALVDDITDTLAPEMRSIELEVDAADELVLILSTNEQSDMLHRIGAARRKILTLWRLLQGKPDVIRAFSRLMDRQAAVDEAARADVDELCEYPLPVDVPLRASPSGSALGALRRTPGSSSAVSQLGTRRRDPPLWPAHVAGHLKDRPLPSARASFADLAVRADTDGIVTADEVAHYLSDVYDHLVSLVASSSHCDMVLSRAHSNYLARLSLGLGESTVETNVFASRWTVIGAILVPLNVVTGLWGMNVKVPGQDREDLRNFFLILAGCMAFVVVVIGWARYKKIF